MLDYIRLIAGSVLLLIGIIIFVIQLIGVFRMNYLLNRMHAAAMGDSLGLFLCLIGLIIISGFNFTSVKMLLVIAFLWCTSPVASHLISKMEADTSEDAAEHYAYMSLAEVEKELNEMQEDK